MTHETELASGLAKNSGLLTVDAVAAARQGTRVPIVDFRLTAIVHDFPEVDVSKANVLHARFLRSG
jgi:hypothetical protein